MGASPAPLIRSCPHLREALSNNSSRRESSAKRSARPEGRYEYANGARLLQVWPVLADAAGAVQYPDTGGVATDAERDRAVANGDHAAGDRIAVGAVAHAPTVMFWSEPMASPTTA